jgi:hypothetical protein
MSTSKKRLHAILQGEAEAGADSPLTRRLLSDDELDWISGGGSHSQTGSGSQYTMSGQNSYTQSGGTYYQDANSFSYSQSWGTVGKVPRSVDPPPP